MKPHLLIVDDDLSIRLVLEHIFKNDFNVMVTSNPYNALDWLEEGNIPEMILMDLKMPQMDGLEFIGLLKESGFFNEIPIIVLSCSDDNDLKIACMEKGASMYLTKPFNPEQILSIVKDFSIKNNNQYV